MIDFSPAYRLGSAGPERFLMRLLTALLVSLAAIEAASAGVVFLGPTPYLSRADSPFPVDGSNPNFYLEDFEDGELNTPGIFQSGISANVIGPSATTNSVDGDNGVIDGLGLQGHALAQTAQIWFPTAPPRHQYQIAFSFDDQALGQLPNAFGFVWTEGSLESEISLRLHDAFGNEISTFALFGIGDDVHVGDTGDHVFLGVISDVEIARVLITSSHIGNNPVPLQIDHVQYGRVRIPEPQGGNTIFLLTLLAVLLSHNVSVRSPRQQAL